jgi:hypothetical protein
MYTLKNYREMLDLCLKAEEGNKEAERNDTSEV